MKILFLLKQRVINNEYAASYGLINSANQVASYLKLNGNKCQVTSVIDGNAIDREVFRFRPDVVIIEALWCPVYNLKELMNMILK